MTEDRILEGRRAIDARAWDHACDLLSAADADALLAAADLEQLAFASYMIGREDDMVGYLERAHQLHLEARDVLAAARAGIWIGIDLALRGASGPASGWFARSQRLIKRRGEPCAETGYLIVADTIRQAGSGEHEAAIEMASRAVAIGEQFEEPDLVALALHVGGRSLVRLGQVDEGLRLLDEAMVAVTADDLTPIVTGIIYCSVIEGCYEVQELRRAYSWTEALSDWCGGQPDLVAFTGQCLTHRAELMQLRGEWDRALDQAHRAAERFVGGMNQFPAAHAHYRRGELHRLRGEYDEAESAYRSASTWGWAPQPGLALLRLAEGNLGAARAALTTALGEVEEPVDRARLLPALIETLLETRNAEEARHASEELDAIADVYSSTMVAATAHHARGAVLLAGGRPSEALVALREARSAWMELDVPYETARVRTRIGQAYDGLGDAESAAFELDAARAVFESLGAQPDLDRMSRRHDARSSSLLTDRELEVLSLVAVGKTNKAIADELFVSDRTIDRHVSNIFAKLGVSSRTAAAAYAFQRKLV